MFCYIIPLICIFCWKQPKLRSIIKTNIITNIITIYFFNILNFLKYYIGHVSSYKDDNILHCFGFDIIQNYDPKYKNIYIF